MKHLVLGSSGQIGAHLVKYLQDKGEQVLEYGWDEYNKFVAMISVPMPYVNQFNYNATLKIDDKAFKGPNGGVWCHQIHNLRNRSNYTDWSAYIGDEVID